MNNKCLHSQKHIPTPLYISKLKNQHTIQLILASAVRMTIKSHWDADSLDNISNNMCLGETRNNGLHKFSLALQNLTFWGKSKQVYFFQCRSSWHKFSKVVKSYKIIHASLLRKCSLFEKSDFDMNFWGFISKL